MLQKNNKKKNKEKNKDKNIADKKKNNLTKQLTDVFVLAWEHLLFSGHKRHPQIFVILKQHHNVGWYRSFSTII